MRAQDEGGDLQLGMRGGGGRWASLYRGAQRGGHVKITKKPGSTRRFSTKRSPALLRPEVGDDADCWARDISGTWVLGRDGDRPKRRGRKGWRGIGLPGRAGLLAIGMEIG